MTANKNTGVFRGIMRAESTDIHSAKDALDQIKSFFGNPDWRRLGFYLGIPTLLAFYGATTSVQSFESYGFWQTLRFYFAHAYVPWWMTCLCTRLIFILFARWQPRSVYIWILGALLSCVLLTPYLGWVGVVLPSNNVSQVAEITVGQFALHAIRVVTIWVLANYLFERFLLLPRYRYKTLPATAALEEPAVFNATTSVNFAKNEESVPLPAFLEGSKHISKAEDLFSVSAEEHYIRVHTSAGDELIYKRFCDAVRELDGFPGIRIHRSHWVSPFAVSRISSLGKKMTIRLKDGQELPVSRPYQAMVRKLEQQCGN